MVEVLNSFTSNINTNYNVYFLLLNIITLIANCYLSLRQKYKLDKELEKYKHQLQTEFVKVEVRTKQLFNIYPTMFANFKTVERELLYLKGPIERKRVPLPQEEKEVEASFIKANNYCIFNMLFLSEDVSTLALDLCELMGNSFYSESEITEIQWEKLKNTLVSLEIQMKKELSNTEKNTK